MTRDQDLEEFQKALQEQILEQARKEYSEAVIERWMNPRNLGKLDNPDGYSKVVGSCGDTIEIFIRMDQDTIAECSFVTDGCGATLACASMATDLAKGRSFREALATVRTDVILQKLGGLPEGNVHCAQLASQSLRHALADVLHHRQAPWKKTYRKT
ncbi:MAG: iron-sulfur cluster assembly scaffold protein [Candidatus Aminicenantes bacterium]|jgi:nitrogen fixation NifU-like protein|nr:iron-sulfur cluster assembly scaffold protein [Candidatus Aminicenantes bacterium]